MEDLAGLTDASAGVPRVLDTVYAADGRGVFSKPFPAIGDGTPFAVRELFWSASSRGSIRGMHFQTPPAAIAKLVWVSRGSILDVVVDLRRGEHYGAVTAVELSASEGRVLWVPAHFAHGFQALEDDTIVNYATDGLFDPERDKGVRWDSVDVAWPLAPGAISPRDAGHPALDDFDTPFA